MPPAELPPKTEPELRYLLPGKKIGVTDLGSYFRTLAGVIIWLGLPPLCARLLGRRGQPHILHKFLVWWVRQMRRYLAVKLDITGLEQINPHQNYIITPLHEGFGDVLALMELPLVLRFAARDELFREWKLLGPFLRDTGQLEINPEAGVSSYRHLLQLGRAVLDRGESLVVFPQGTILGIESDFNVGAFALARALKKPLLPVALTGSHRIWEYPYTPRLRYGQRISMRVLPPIAVETILQHSREEMRRMVQKQLKAVALAGEMAAPRRFVPARDGYWDGYAYRIDPQFDELAADIAHHRAQLLAKPKAVNSSQKV